MRSLLCFDFDGTIVDTRQLFLEAIQHVCLQRGVSCPSLEVLRNFSAPEIFKKMGLSSLGVYFFVRDCRTYIRDHYRDLSPCEGVSELLESLLSHPMSERYSLGILSSNKTKNIEVFLEKNSLRAFFKYVVGDVSLWRKSQALYRLMHQQKIYDGYYVGDEERDILAAQKSGYKSIAVSWGIKESVFLQKYNPTYFVNSPKELTALLLVIA
jgi:phosphoglycolate phosphatase